MGPRFFARYLSVSQVWRSDSRLADKFGPMIIKNTRRLRLKSGHMLTLAVAVESDCAFWPFRISFEHASRHDITFWGECPQLRAEAGARCTFRGGYRSDHVVDSVIEGRRGTARRPIQSLTAAPYRAITFDRCVCCPPERRCCCRGTRFSPKSATLKALTGWPGREGSAGRIASPVSVLILLEGC
jgi:hypothetical protein